MLLERKELLLLLLSCLQLGLLPLLILNRTHRQHRPRLEHWGVLSANDY